MTSFRLGGCYSATDRTPCRKQAFALFLVKGQSNRNRLPVYARQSAHLIRLECHSTATTLSSYCE